MNYLCSKPNCHSNCSTDDNILSAVLTFTVKLLPCSHCYHGHWSHSHTRSKWVQRQEYRVTVDHDMKRKWEAAKDEKEKTEALVAASERTLGALSCTMDTSMDELVRLAGVFGRLSLSGSSSRPLEKAIRLVEQRYKKMEEQGVSRDQLEKMQTSLDDMKRRLDVLKKAQEKEMAAKAKVA